MIKLKVSPRLEAYIRVLLDQGLPSDQLVWKNKKQLLEVQSLLKTGREISTKHELVDNELTGLQGENPLKKDFELLQAALTTSFLNPETLKVLKKYSQKSNGPPLFEKYSDANVIFESPKLIEDEESNEVKLAKQKRREYLKMKSEERSYNRMIYGSDKNPHIDKSITLGTELKSLKYQVSIAFNIIFAVLASFGIGYYIMRQWGKGTTESMVVGLACGILMLIVEMLLYIMRHVQLEESYEKPQSNKEIALAKFNTGALVTPADKLATGDLYEKLKNEHVIKDQDFIEELKTEEGDEDNEDELAKQTGGDNSN